MRKGAERRQEILQAAEALFCQNGYEATSIQDILDALKLSKGGFYHHFSSKEAVLNALCARYAKEAADSLNNGFETAESPIERINAVLHAFIPLRREQAEFMAMLLPYLNKPEARATALTYQDALLSGFMPILAREINAAHRAEAVHLLAAGMEHPVLCLVNSFWLDAAELLRQAMAEDHLCDTAALLSVLERYRRSIEALLDAPFGSIEMIRVEELDAVLERIRHAQNS